MHTMNPTPRKHADPEAAEWVDWSLKYQYGELPDDGVCWAVPSVARRFYLYGSGADLPAWGGRLCGTTGTRARDIALVEAVRAGRATFPDTPRHGSCDVGRFDACAAATVQPRRGDMIALASMRRAAITSCDLVPWSEEVGNHTGRVCVAVLEAVAGMITSLALQTYEQGIVNQRLRRALAAAFSGCAMEVAISSPGERAALFALLHETPVEVFDWRRGEGDDDERIAVLAWRFTFNEEPILILTQREGEGAP